VRKGGKGGAVRGGVFVLLGKLLLKQGGGRPYREEERMFSKKKEKALKGGIRPQTISTGHALLREGGLVDCNNPGRRGKGKGR